MPGKTGTVKGMPSSEIDASMRPRLYAGENVECGYICSLSISASMRPRLYAGENLKQRGNLSFNRISFNEAPALCRGKRYGFKAVFGIGYASMRPRLYAGENESERTDSQAAVSCFNEAPALCRGKQKIGHVLRSSSIKLQ